MRLHVPGGRCAALAFAAGALAALGHAPLYLWPLTILGLAGLTRLVAAAPKGAGWLGLFGGMGYGAIALSWIVEPFLIEPETYGWMAPFALFFMDLGLILSLVSKILRYIFARKLIRSAVRIVLLGGQRFALPGNAPRSVIVVGEWFEICAHSSSG